MSVKTLRAVEYEPDGWTWRAHEAAAPGLEQVETAIRRLDRFHWPFVDLGLEGGSGGYMTVVGGQGAYSLNGTLDYNRYFRFYDASRSADIVELWTSDQGHEAEEYYVCYDLSWVLKIARYFFEVGQLDPSFTWEWS